MPPKNDEPNRVFDVAKPGTSDPDSTSRPVIVGHKKMVEDPMVNSAAGIKKDEADVESLVARTEEKKLTPSQAKPITPLSKPAEKEAPETAAPADQKTDETETKETTEPPKPEETPPQNGIPGAAPDAKPTNKAEAVSEEEKIRQAAVDKMIASKQYIVHVGESKSQHKNLKLIILAAAGVLLIFIAWLLLTS